MNEEEVNRFFSDMFITILPEAYRESNSQEEFLALVQPLGKVLSDKEKMIKSYENMGENNE
ncbi:MAG: hypothetical protein KAG37_03995 [Flavobacteriales bacterium]|nr:hypothetical protein [Flavobacteriales bacterium]